MPQENGDFSEIAHNEVRKLVEEGYEKSEARRIVVDRVSRGVRRPDENETARVAQKHGISFEDAYHALMVSRQFKCLKMGGLDSHGAVEELTRQMTNTWIVKNEQQEVLRSDNSTIFSSGSGACGTQDENLIENFSDNELRKSSRRGNLKKFSPDRHNNISLEKQRYLAGLDSLRTEPKRTKRPCSPDEEKMGFRTRVLKRAKTGRESSAMTSNRSPVNRQRVVLDGKRRRSPSLQSDIEAASGSCTKRPKVQQ